MPRIVVANHHLAEGVLHMIFSVLQIPYLFVQQIIISIPQDRIVQTHED